MTFEGAGNNAYATFRLTREQLAALAELGITYVESLDSAPDTASVEAAGEPEDGDETSVNRETRPLEQAVEADGTADQPSAQQREQQEEIRRNFLRARDLYNKRLTPDGRLDISGMSKAKVLMNLQHEALKCLCYSAQIGNPTAIKHLERGIADSISLKGAMAALENMPRRDGIEFVGNVPLGNTGLADSDQYLNVTGPKGFDIAWPGAALRALQHMLLERGDPALMPSEHNDDWVNGNDGPLIFSRSTGDTVASAAATSGDDVVLSSSTVSARPRNGSNARKPWRPMAAQQQNTSSRARTRKHDPTLRHDIIEGRLRDFKQLVDGLSRDIPDTHDESTEQPTPGAGEDAVQRATPQLSDRDTVEHNIPPVQIPRFLPAPLKKIISVIDVIGDM